MTAAANIITLPVVRRTTQSAGYANVGRLWLVARALRDGPAAGRPVNATTLAADLGVCQLTIHRDLEFLRHGLRHDLAYEAKTRTWRYQTLPPVTFL